MTLLTAFGVYKMPIRRLDIEIIHKLCLQGGHQKTGRVLIRNQRVPIFELIVALVDFSHFEVEYIVVSGRIELP